MTQPRVAIVVDSLSIGGAERIVVDSAIGLAGRGWEPTVVVLETSPTFFADELDAAGVPVVWLPTPARHQLTDPRRLMGLIRTFRRGGFAVVHTHLGTANTLGTVAARLAGVASVATLHIGFEPHRHARLRRGLETLVLRGARRVIAVGPQVAAEAEARLRRPVTILPNPVRPPVHVSETERAALRRELTGESEGVLIAAAGRLEPVKGWPDLLVAFGLVAGRERDVRLVVAGDGRQRQALRHLADQLGIADRVFAVGARADLPRILAAADLFASASLDEGLPLTVLEALAAGTPVVATRVGDVAEVVLPDAGFVVAPSRPEELAEAMLTAVGDAGWRARAGRAGRERIMTAHGMDQWLGRLAAIYADVAAR